jgi:aerobic carbon-monoxide dehydrogenase small subunit
MSASTAIEQLPIEIVINGIPRRGLVEPRVSLVDFIRHEAGLTGTHVGCEVGVCGACTVVIDGVARRSCLTLAVQANGHDVMTVEGLSTDGQLHPIQEAFVDNQAFQCAFCSPGFLMSIYTLLDGAEELTVSEIRKSLIGNICRCTGYEPIIDGVVDAAGRLGIRVSDG